MQQYEYMCPVCGAHVHRITTFTDRKRQQCFDCEAFMTMLGTGDLPVIWTHDEALLAIRVLQPKIKPLGFHVALAGGVLNHGSSEKDLDLVFLPLTNDEAPVLTPLMTLLCEWFGDIDTDFSPSHVPNPYTPYRTQQTFANNGKRVDVFVL